MNQGIARAVAILLASAVVCDARAAAGDRLDAVASCYRALSLSPPAIEDSHAYFVLLDQTTVFDASLQQCAGAAVDPFKLMTEQRVRIVRRAQRTHSLTQWIAHHSRRVSRGLVTAACLCVPHCSSSVQACVA